MAKELDALQKDSYVGTGPTTSLEACRNLSVDTRPGTNKKGDIP